MIDNFYLKHFPALTDEPLNVLGRSVQPSLRKMATYTHRQTNGYLIVYILWIVKSFLVLISSFLISTCGVYYSTAVLEHWYCSLVSGFDFVPWGEVCFQYQPHSTQVFFDNCFAHFLMTYFVTLLYFKVFVRCFVV